MTKLNPVGSFVNKTEKPVRDELCLNGKWQFMPVYETDMTKFANVEKYAEFKQAGADRSPKDLGVLIKNSEIHYHHEVTNQALWNAF